VRALTRIRKPISGLQLLLPLVNVSARFNCFSDLAVQRLRTRLVRWTISGSPV
jgi:hypothetical protein